MQKILSAFVRPVHQSYFVVALAVGVVVGTILALVFRVNFFASPLWLAVVAVVLVVAYLRPRAALVAVALVAGMLLAFFRATDELKGEDYIRQFYDQTVTITGTVDGDPNNDETGTKFKLKDLKFGENGEKATTGNIYITAKSTPELARSDRVTVSGKLLGGFGTYAGYLYKPTIVKIARPSPGDPALNFRNWFAERIASQLPEPENSLGLSYLLGMRTGLPDELNEDLRTVGLVHIVVASGAHLSILVEVARRIFGKASRLLGLLLSVAFVLFFMALVGFTPSIMRAGLMSILALAAWYVGRRVAAWRLILLVAAATLVFEPMLVINLGWLLSFASFAGIMILGPRLSRFFYGDRQPKFVASTVLTTIAATLMTLPLTLYYFGTVSIISVVANLLILPTLSYAMGLTFLTGVLADVPLLNTVVGFATTKLLDFHMAVVDFFAEAKSFLVTIEPYQPWVLGVYVVILVPLAVGLVRQKLRQRRQPVELGSVMPDTSEKFDFFRQRW